MDNQNNSNSTPPAPDPTPASPWSTPPTPPPMPEPAPVPAWTPPVPAGTPFPPMPESPAPAPTAPESAPMPTFTPPSSIPTPEANAPIANTSSLDNPWGAPTQPPPIDSSPATAAPFPTEPSWMNTAPAESAPTDLSHLINESSNTPPPAETLVVPPAPAANPETPGLTTETHKGIPKWLLGLGIVLLILVIGASAYFILGIGQPSKPTTSLPAVTAPKAAVTQPTPPPPTATPVATGSASFESLQGSGSAPQATSAAELLRQRNQGR